MDDVVLREREIVLVLVDGVHKEILTGGGHMQHMKSCSNTLPIAHGRMTATHHKQWAKHYLGELRIRVLLVVLLIITILLFVVSRRQHRGYHRLSTFITARC